MGKSAALVFGGLAIGVVIGALDAYADRLVKYVHNGNKIQDKKVLLVLSAVGLEEGLAHIGSYRLRTLHLQEHTHIVYKSLCSIQDINQAIETTAKDNRNIITGLFIRAHGAPNFITLTSNCLEENPMSYLSNKDIIGAEGRKLASKNIDLLKESLNLLASDACIYLESCSTGKITENDDGQTAIAQSLANLAPGRLVIAPFADCSGRYSAFKWKGDRLDVTFKQLNGSSVLIRTLSAIFGLMFFPVLGVKDSITARFKSVGYPSG